MIAWRSFLCLAVTGFLWVWAAPSSAQLTPTPFRPAPPPPPPPSMHGYPPMGPDLDLRASASGERYEASFTGISAYMEDLERSDRHRHELLLPVFDELRTRRRRTVLAGLGILAGGVALAVPSGVAIAGGSEHRAVYPLLIGGAVLSGAGLATMQSLMYRGSKDAKRFMEEHNRLIPEEPLLLEFAAMPGSFAIAASYRLRAF